MPISHYFPEAGITFWDVGHECNGGYMADGFTRSTGKMAMIIAQNGPGITNFDNCGKSTVLEPLRGGGMNSSDVVPPLYFSETIIDSASKAVPSEETHAGFGLITSPTRSVAGSISAATRCSAWSLGRELELGVPPPSMKVPTPSTVTVAACASTRGVHTVCSRAVWVPFFLCLPTSVPRLAPKICLRYLPTQRFGRPAAARPTRRAPLRLARSQKSPTPRGG